MTRVPPEEPAPFAWDPNEDTIEMVLSPDDMHRLSRAAEEQERAAASETEAPLHAPPVAPATQIGTAPSPPRASPDVMSRIEAEEPLANASATASRRRPAKNIKSAALGALAGAAGALVVVATIASWSTAHRTPQAETTPPPEPIVSTAPTAPQPATATATATATAMGTATAPAPSPQQPAAPDAQPVRFKNPFDKREVFEFPPGTTLEEARQSVADVLKQRARDRKVQRVTQQRSRIARND